MATQNTMSILNKDSRFKAACLIASIVCGLSSLGVSNAKAETQPTKVRIALVPGVGPENVWDASALKAIARVGEQHPNGLAVTADMKEAVFGDKAETVLRLLAKSGNYDIIVSTGPRSDQIEKIKSSYPEILWASLGSGNRGTGANHYLYYGRVHQPAYLLGMLAAGMSNSGVIGVVGSFPAQDINDQVNAYFAGAKSINPQTKVKLTFIESWYDPPKATEAAYAQIAVGAGAINMLAGPVYEPCLKKKVWCFSMYDNSSKLASNAVLSGTILKWDPTIKDLVDIWYSHKVDKRPYEGNTKAKWFSMKDGGSDIEPFEQIGDKIPEELKSKIQDAKAKITSGEFVVPLDESLPKSD